MKVRASVKKRSADCKIVLRKGRLYVITKRILDLNKDKVNIMARIAVIDIPKNKRVVISLTYIFGIGNSRASKILDTAGVDHSKKVSDWSDAEISKIREAVGSFTIEGELRSETQLNIKRLMDIGCYRGIRHRAGLPLRGQRTKNNSRTRKGKRKTVANKKKVTK